MSRIIRMAAKMVIMRSPSFAALTAIFIFASLLLYPGIHAILLFPKISHLSGITGMDWEKRNKGRRLGKENPNQTFFSPSPSDPQREYLLLFLFFLPVKEHESHASCYSQHHGIRRNSQYYTGRCDFIDMVVVSKVRIITHQTLVRSF